MGNTLFECEQIDLPESVSQCFIPSSALAELRRETIELFHESLMKALNNKPANEILDTGNPLVHASSEYRQFPYLYNISNHVAHDFYLNHGLSQPAKAFELTDWKNATHSPLLMQCKHCLRFAFGYCVKNGGKTPKWKEPLFLQLPDGQRFRLQFDCQKCQMNVYDS